MGYYAYFEGADFRIPQENKRECLQTIVEVCEERELRWTRGGVDTWNNLEDAMEAMRWKVNTDIESGDIVGIEAFRGEKLGEDLHFFQTIAEYVEDGSYIKMRGEDGAYWMWKFEDGNVREIEGRVVYDGGTDES